MAVLAKFPTKPANPVRLSGDPCVPFFNGKIVEQVGHAIRGVS